MTEATTTRDKINEIIAEMKRQGLWRQEMPAWVTDYGKKTISKQEDFAGWLQFVFLPNQLLQEKRGVRQKSRQYIVLQAKSFFEQDMHKGRLLQLLVELDALT